MSGSAQFLLGIATRSEECHRTQLEQEALAAARSVTDGLARAQALGNIAVSLNGNERDRILAEAVQAAGTHPYEFRSVYALDYLIPLHAPAQRQLIIADALTATRGMSDTVHRAWWLAALARHVPTSQRSALLTEALETAHSLPPGQQQLQALTQIAVSFPGGERLGVFDELISLTESAGGHLPPAGRIVRIVRILPGRTILNVLELVRQAMYEDGQLSASGRILRHVPNALIEKALDVLHDHPVGLHKAHALGTAALYMPAELREKTLGLARMRSKERLPEEHS